MRFTAAEVSEDKFQTLRKMVEQCLPGELEGEAREYRFLAPWLFVRADLWKGVWKDRWYRDMFGLSMSRIFRDTWMKGAPRVRFATGVDCVFVKLRAARYFDREGGSVHKVLPEERPEEKENLARDVAMRAKYAGVVETIAVLESGEDSLVEPITEGRRMLEQEFLRSDKAAAELVKAAVAIAGVEEREEEGGVLSAGSHGDFQIHNLFWDPEKKRFIVIDWERAGRGPLLWDSFLFFLLLLNKKAVRRSGGLMKRFDLVAGEHFREVVKALELERGEVERQWEECERRYEELYGGDERRRYGKGRVSEKLGRLRKGVFS